MAHVLRCFEDGDITHVEGKIDPVADAETIETELMIADMESIERRLTGLAKKLRGGDQDTLDQDRLLRAALKLLEAGHPARNLQIAEEDQRQWRLLQLLTSKPVLYVCNVEESCCRRRQQPIRPRGRNGRQAGGGVGGDLGED